MTRISGPTAETAAPASDFSAAEMMRGALEFHAAGRFDMARSLYERILAVEPENSVAWHHLGLIAHVDGDHLAAADHVRRATQLKPDYAQAYSNLAAIYRVLGDFEAAAAAAGEAVALDPNFAAGHSNLGNAREDLGEFEAALEAYREACRLDPHFVEAHANAADLLRKLKRHEEALAVCDTIVEKRPDAARPYFCAGNILRELLRASEAIDAFRQAIALQPRFAEAYCNLGNLLLRQGAYQEAIEAYEQAIAIKPTIAQAYCNLGAAYELANRSPDALKAYAKAIELEPSLIGVEVQLLHQRRLACDWDGIEEAEARLLEKIPTCKDMLPPFGFLSMDTPPATQLQVAKLWATGFHARAFAHARPGPGAERKKLRIGYLSSDFHRHATAHLIAELFERHDRSRFAIIGYSHGAEDCSEMRYRLGKAFDAFVDLRDFDDAQVAQRIFDDEIDILVDLKGYTQLSRTEIAAHRPAPIQVNYLGYPGTMGCDFINYIIADPIILPMDQQPFYTEKIVHLPECYQPNDTQRRVSDLTPSRADCGLPEMGFVFCCFNNSYKITPHFFSIWMRLLAGVPGSVLWLFDANPQVKGNLEKEAQKRGIDPARLVFAPRLGPADHLARQRLADLFLDCLPYNAHTTTSDALWVGLPVLTLIGETFAGRVAASLLNAVGLPELVTASEADYEAAALQLANEPQRLAEIRRKLQINRPTHPLFDTSRYTAHLEAAFIRMWELWAEGEPAQAFAIAPLPVEPSPETASIPKLPPAVELVPLAREPYRACPLCGGQDHTSLLTTDGSRDALYHAQLPRDIEWRSCRACGHVFTQGYFAAEALPPPAMSLGDAMEDGRYAAAPIVARIARYGAGGAWLDAAVGTGALLFTAAEWGYVPVGLDPSPETAEGLRRLGIEAHCGGLPDLNGMGRFSVISLADLLPCQPFPNEMLQAAQRLLRPGGLLFLSMPNREPMLFNLLQAFAANPHWGEIDRYHLFSRSRLYRLLRDCGFEPIDYQISATHKVGMEVIARKLG